MDEIKVNDGKGLYDSDGLISTLILDCGEITKALVSGEYVQFNLRIVHMFQKLEQLRDGIRNDREDLERQIRELREENECLMARVLGIGGDGGAA
jgi:hypothetical protein